MKIIIIILWLVLLLSLFGIFWTYVGYPISLFFSSKIFKKKHKYDKNFTPAVSLMIMSYNEEKVIEKKIRNSVKQNYPKEKLQIMVVDSASTDKTREIVREYKNVGVELIEQDKRKGKASGVNFGLEFARGEIIIVTDSNAIMHRNAIKNLVKHFSDHLVGGVCGKYYVKKSKDTAETQGTDIYWKFEEFLRKNESDIDSVISMSGEISAIRKELTGKFDEKNLCEDFDIAAKVRQRGYRLIYEPDALVYEYAPSTTKDVITQKKRIVIGTIQTLLKYKKMLFNPMYGWYGILILPSHKLLQIINPFLLVVIFLSSILIFLLTKNIFIYYFISIEILLIIFSIIALITLKIKPELKFLPFMLIKYFLTIQFVCMIAFRDYLNGKYKVTWEKIESSRKF